MVAAYYCRKVASPLAEPIGCFALANQRKETLMNGSTVRAIEATFDELSAAWKNGDGTAFAECCTADVDFVNLLGMHVKGRRSVAELHARIFSGPYKDSTVAFTLESVRVVSPTAVLVIAPSRLDIPSGPVKGIVLSIASVLLVRDGERWKLANFHNTRREATEPGHLSIMRETVDR